MELPEHFLSCAVGESNAVNDSILVSRYEANTFHLPASTAVNEMSPGSKRLLTPRAMYTITSQEKDIKANLSISKVKLYLLKKTNNKNTSDCFLSNESLQAVSLSLSIINNIMCQEITRKLCFLMFVTREELT